MSSLWLAKRTAKTDFYSFAQNLPFCHITIFFHLANLGQMLYQQPFSTTLLLLSASHILSPRETPLDQQTTPLYQGFRKGSRTLPACLLAAIAIFTLLPASSLAFLF
jgi:hypothetical protein